MKRAAMQVGAAAAIAAVAGYVAQFLAARWLGPEDFTHFAVFWSLLFILAGTLGGAAQEVIRVVRVAKLVLDAGVESGRTRANPRIGVVAVVVGLTSSGLLLVFGLIFGQSTLGSGWLATVGLLSLAGALIGGALAVGSTSAGLAQWRTYSAVVALEALARMTLFVAAAVFAPTVIGFSVAAVLAFVPQILVALLSKTLRRQSFSIRSDTGLGGTTSRILQTMLAAAISGILVIGWAAILAAAADFDPRGSTAVSLGVLVLLVTLTRAPIMVPLSAFQNVLIARFTGFDARTQRRWVLLGSVGILVVSGVLAGLAALVGPPLLPVVFGSEYQTEPGIVAALTAASSGLGVITLTSVATMTAKRHGVYLLGWGTAIAVSFATIFFAPLPFEWATAAALFVGPFLGAALQASALRPPRPAAQRKQDA